ncbi:DUF3299 domain-containing protein [Allohahella marinimesophila]|uniref:DUF3299 domain-containing protein n=1 Tax=Allohahella marinimesophila TaxID=1054972 RepID=A0ABP7NT62_9GAMM
MMNVKKYSLPTLLFLLVLGLVQVSPGLMGEAVAKDESEFRMIEWIDLIPEDDLEALMNPPEWIMNIPDGSEADNMDLLDQPQSSAIGEDDTKDKAKQTEEEKKAERYQAALKSSKFKAEFDGAKVKVPGFIVPIESKDDQTVTTFFLVPYFGACIHTPPPPPNQIIYATFPKGFKLESLYDAFWLEGTMETSLVTNDIATSTYTIKVENIIPYTEEPIEEPAE